MNTAITTTAPIARKTTFAVSYLEVTIDGDIRTQSKWFESLDLIPAKFIYENDAKIIKRSYDVFAKPSLSEFKACVASNNRYWLNTNEVITELDYCMK